MREIRFSSIQSVKMSLKVIKAGLLDSIQDAGRYGYQQLGINPGGVMDRYSLQAINILLSNAPGEAVIEMHFPAPAFRFEQEAMIALGGADFHATINGEPIPSWHPVLVNKNRVLQFEKRISGGRCYLAVKNGFDIQPWLGSASTNLKAGAGGFRGRALQKEDVLAFKKPNSYSRYLEEKDFVVLPWSSGPDWEHSVRRFNIVPGNEWERVEQLSGNQLFQQAFTILNASDRMGYRLNGIPLKTGNKGELISSAVSFGTIQLLPDGQLIILMADHQTTGGYPRIAHVISADLPGLAQQIPGDKINFKLTNHAFAEKELFNQQHHLAQLQNACTFRLEEFLSR